MNNVVLVGRICNDLELRGTSERPVCNLNLAVDGYNDKTDFIPVAVFGKQAENLVKYQSKGSQIAIEGKISQDTYTDKDGNKRSSIKVIANRVKFLGSKSSDRPISEADVIMNHIGLPKSQDIKVNQEPLEDDDIPF